MKNPISFKVSKIKNRWLRRLVIVLTMPFMLLIQWFFIVILLPYMLASETGRLARSARSVW